MLIRPRSSARDALALVPLAALGAMVGGLVAGALSAHVPVLVARGPGFGGQLTLAGAVGSFLLAWGGLFWLRRRGLDRTAFDLAPDGLCVSWPGFEHASEWLEIGAVDRIEDRCVLLLESGLRLVLFNLADPQQCEGLLRVKVEPLRRRAEQRRAA